MCVLFSGSKVHLSLMVIVVSEEYGAHITGTPNSSMIIIKIYVLCLNNMIFILSFFCVVQTISCPATDHVTPIPCTPMGADGPTTLPLTEHTTNCPATDHYVAPITCTPIGAEGPTTLPLTEHMTEADNMVEPNLSDTCIDVFEEDEEDEEGYLFAGHEEEDEVDVEINLDDEDNGVPNVLDPYDKVYANVPSETHKLEAMDNWQQCNAKKFEYETPGFCCRSGQIHLSTLDTPPELMRLWTASDADARHFRSNIRFFNDHFSFTSLYCNLDRMTTSMRGGGVYVSCPWSNLPQCTFIW